MKQIQSAISALAAISLAILAAGCATELKDKENLAVAAGFEVITPSAPSQIALLLKLPADKVTRITQDGNTYYALPDVKANQVYIGGPKQYRAYQDLRLARKLSNDNLEAAQTDEMASENWRTWEGWGDWGMAGMDGMGWY